MPVALLKYSGGWVSTVKSLRPTCGFRLMPPFRYAQDRVLTLFSVSFHASARDNGQKIVKMAVKKEKSKTRNMQLLRSLRAKKLAGLAPRAVEDFDLEKRIAKERFVNRLLAMYESKRYKEELTQRHKVLILEKIAKVAVEGELNKYRKHAQALESLVGSVLHGVSECDEHSLCRVIAALVQLNITKPGYFEKLGREALKHGLEGFSHEDLSEMCWALGTVNYESEQLFKSVGDEIISRSVTSFSSKCLCRFIWFFQGAPNVGDLFDAIGSELLTRNMSDFESSMLGTIVWAYSKRKPLNKQVFQAIEYELHARELKLLHTRDLVMLVIVFTELELMYRKLFQLLESALILKRDIPQAVSREHLQTFFDLLKDGPYCRAEIMKIVERILYPWVCNSIFDLLYRPRMAWKAKVLKQSLFQPY